MLFVCVTTTCTIVSVGHIGTAADIYASSAMQYGIVFMTVVVCFGLFVAMITKKHKRREELSKEELLAHQLRAKVLPSVVPRCVLRPSSDRNTCL